jgi:hypothetical protein
MKAIKIIIYIILISLFALWINALRTENAEYKGNFAREEIGRMRAEDGKEYWDNWLKLCEERGLKPEYFTGSKRELTTAQDIVLERELKATKREDGAYYSPTGHRMPRQYPYDRKPFICTICLENFELPEELENHQEKTRHNKDLYLYHEQKVIIKQESK